MTSSGKGIGFSKYTRNILVCIQIENTEYMANNKKWWICNTQMEIAHIQYLSKYTTEMHNYAKLSDDINRWWDLMLHKYTNSQVEISNQKKNEIWLSPMTKPPIPTENSKTKGQNTNVTKNLDLHNDCGPT